jgi:hypothetical protein
MLGTQNPMILRRVITALIVSFLGTFVLYLLGILLVGLVGSVYDLVSCAIGSFISTIIFSNPKYVGFKSNIKPAVGIVFFTFVFISVGYVAYQVFERKVAVDFAPIGQFIWATLATSWWLIPLTAFVLSTINSRFNGYRGRW